MKSVEAYRQLRNDVDELSAGLAALHGAHLCCRRGCSGCCTNLSVLPVEYDVILRDLRDAGVTSIIFDPNEPCGFLKDGMCSLYAARPLICRTHGLPIAFTNETFDPPETNVSFCPMNFSEVDLDEYEFGPHNTIDLDRLNGRLQEVNAIYLSELPPSSRPPQRVPLAQLAKDLHSYVQTFASLME